MVVELNLKFSTFGFVLFLTIRRFESKLTLSFEAWGADQFGQVKDPMGLVAVEVNLVVLFSFAYFSFRFLLASKHWFNTALTLLLSTLFPLWCSFVNTSKITFSNFFEVFE